MSPATARQQVETKAQEHRYSSHRQQQPMRSAGATTIARKILSIIPRRDSPRANQPADPAHAPSHDLPSISQWRAAPPRDLRSLYLRNGRLHALKRFRLRILPFLLCFTASHKVRFDIRVKHSFTSHITPCKARFDTGARALHQAGFPRTPPSHVVCLFSLHQKL